MRDSIRRTASRGWECPECGCHVENLDAHMDSHDREGGESKEGEES